MIEKNREHLILHDDALIHRSGHDHFWIIEDVQCLMKFFAERLKKTAPRRCAYRHRIGQAFFQWMLRGERQLFALPGECPCLGRRNMERALNASMIHRLIEKNMDDRVSRDFNGVSIQIAGSARGGRQKKSNSKNNAKKSHPCNDQFPITFQERADAFDGGRRDVRRFRFGEQGHGHKMEE
ncbi:MAG: hypothetical protein A2X93_09375 [Deltaproteobacteria bacterium GWC2_56_8]|nr:MAG: hypothetical protein A2X93_09375 [Deltaproteobacteria bacterium GWC2_56_8]